MQTSTSMVPAFRRGHVPRAQAARERRHRYRRGMEARHPDAQHLSLQGLIVMLCREYGFHLAQEHYWWNPPDKYAGGVGQHPPRTCQGRDQHGVVDIEDTVAEGKQPPRSHTLQRRDGSAPQVRLQSKVAPFGPRHQREVRAPEPWSRAAQFTCGREHGI